MRFSRFAPLAFLGILTSGCGDSTGPEGDTLTDAELDVLMELIFVVGSLPSTDSGPAAAAAGVPSAVPFNISVDETAPCPEGGTVRVQGTAQGDLDPDTGNGSIIENVTETFQSCRATSQESGISFTLDTDPSITAEVTAVSSDTSLELDASMNGKIRWMTDGKSGACSVSLTASMTVSGETIQLSSSGVVCGVSRSVTASIG